MSRKSMKRYIQQRKQALRKLNAKPQSSLKPEERFLLEMLNTGFDNAEEDKLYNEMRHDKD